MFEYKMSSDVTHNTSLTIKIIEINSLFLYADYWNTL